VRGSRLATNRHDHVGHMAFLPDHARARESHCGECGQAWSLRTTYDAQGKPLWRWEPIPEGGDSFDPWSSDGTF